MTTVLLHGFWGGPEDWNPVVKTLPLSASLWIPDLYEQPPQDLKSWVESFHNELHRRGDGPFQLVGYSMGGRLALNALVLAPKLFSRALILSAAPENSDPEREAWEKHWGIRFEGEDWNSLAAAWQEQSVFDGGKPVARRQTETLRARLGQSLLQWSPRQHLFDRDGVKALPPAVDWAFGALDQKYVKVAKALQELPVQGQISVIENAGHRLVQEASDFIAEWIARGKGA
jgi:2-succinyl-6-hydroxy-2,4-cyclohexadiene-1-carboxylate synthase